MISGDESDAAPIQTKDLNQPAADDQPATEGSSGDQAIIIHYSPELAPIIRTELNGPIDQNRTRMVRLRLHSK